MLDKASLSGEDVQATRNAEGFVETRVEQDVDQSLKTYFSWRFFLGFMVMMTAIGIEIYCLQFVDLTLNSCTTGVHIVIAIFLSTNWLGETFTWRYDFVALVLIITGCVTIALNANTTQTTYTATEIIDLLKAPRTSIFISSSFLCILVSLCLLRNILQRLRLFEKDAEAYQALHLEIPILPAR